jgi:hypothetical protein
MTNKEVIQLWKENDVERINFIFDCGGDSMNDTSFEIINSKEEYIEVPELENYFDNEVYRNVKFYENSDGHYQGENGRVVITLAETYDEVNDEDEDEPFIYEKISESEWCEHYEDTKIVELTDEEVDFIDKYVSDINGNMDEDEYNVNYKIDFIQTPELVEFEDKLVEKFKHIFMTHEPNIDNLGLWHTLQIDATKLNKVDKSIEIDMDFEYTKYTDGSLEH